MPREQHSQMLTLLSTSVSCSQNSSELPADSKCVIYSCTSTGIASYCIIYFMITTVYGSRHLSTSSGRLLIGPDLHLNMPREVQARRMTNILSHGCRKP